MLSKAENASFSHILRILIPCQESHFTNIFYFQQQLPGNQEFTPVLEGMSRLLARSPGSCMAKDSG